MTNLCGFSASLSDRYGTFCSARFDREPSGWRLSPAFDINPNTAKQTHALAIDSKNAEPNVAMAMAQAQLYRLSGREAENMLAQVTAVVAGWRDEAARLGLPSVEVRRMETVIGA